MSDKAFNNTIRTAQITLSAIVLTLVGIVLYHGVILNQFEGAINF